MQNVAKYKYLFALFDFFLFLGIVGILSSFFDGDHYIVQKFFGLSGTDSVWLLMFLLPTFYFILYFNNLYKLNIVLNRSAHVIVAIKSLLYFLPLFVLFDLIVLRYNFSYTLLTTFSFIVTFILLFYIFRIEVLKRAYLFLKKNGFTRNVLIVGNGGSGELLAAKLSFENPFGINVVGFIDEKIEKGEEIIGGKKVLGRICEINNIRF